MTTTKPTDCPKCAGYLRRRRAVLLPALGIHVQRTGEVPARALGRILNGAHARHQAPRPLSAIDLTA